MKIRQCEEITWPSCFMDGMCEWIMLRLNIASTQSNKLENIVNCAFHVETEKSSQKKE